MYIQIFENSVTLSDPHNYDGFVQVRNMTGGDLYRLEVTPMNSDQNTTFGFSYRTTDMLPYTGAKLPNTDITQGTLYVPVDSSYPDLYIEYTLVEGDAPITSTQSIVALAGAPKIKSTSPAIETWTYARCSGAVQVRNDSEKNRPVWAQLGDRGPTEVTVGSGPATFEDAAGDEDPLLVSLSSDMSDSTPITVIHQDGPTVNVSDAGSDFSVDTQVVSADTNGQSGTLYVAYQGTSTSGIEVTKVDFDLAETVVGTVLPDSTPLAVTVDDTIALLRIGAPPSAEESDQRRPKAAPAPGDDGSSDPDDDGYPAFIPLGGDPVVLVKHIGYTSGG